jgi:hypothetical protein
VVVEHVVEANLVRLCYVLVHAHNVHECAAGELLVDIHLVLSLTTDLHIQLPDFDQVLEPAIVCLLFIAAPYQDLEVGQIQPLGNVCVVGSIEHVVVDEDVSGMHSVDHVSFFLLCSGVCMLERD